MLRRLTGSERSQSLVEFALALPILLLLALAIVEFGIGFGTYVQLRNAAREGARYAVVGNPAGAYPTDCTGIDNGSVVSRVCTTSGLDLDEMQTVSVTYPNGQVSGNSVVVTARYRYEFITPLSDVASLFGGEMFPEHFDLTATTDMRLE